MGTVRGDKMKSALVLVFACLAANVRADLDYHEMVIRNINKYNFDSKCWGEKNQDVYIKSMEDASDKCMQQETPAAMIAKLAPLQTNPFSPLPAPINNPFKKLIQSGGDLSQLQSLWRNKRAARNGLIEADEDDLVEFLGQVQNFKSDMVSKMGNLTCVLMEMDMLTPEGDINIDYFTTKITGDNLEEGYDWDEEGSAVSDPEFRQRLSDGYAACLKVSESLPQSSFNKSPMKKFFGRHMVFFKCGKKLQKQMCAKAQILEWLEKQYGVEEPEKQAERIKELGLPEDKYDAAALSMAVIINAATQEETFVGEFFWGMGVE